ncbi:RNA polymerase recycling motor HelD [Enterococcus sp. CSURQ0835]|uniref:RNA polymerase recycling motor HelD n=1 Tax=Enterococcus sp. CSURQ0835 TaxID=2681394 RepID=UPI0013598F2C|nr:RNA polymerase recycling motor HelD [Enterococcus sp. CSURQ0835]
MNAREKEQVHVTETVALIDREATFLKQQKQKNQAQFEENLLETTNQEIRTGSNEAMFESAADYRQHEQELMIRYQTLASQEKRQKVLRLMKDNPYFARIDFKEENETETLYLGIASLRDKDEETIVIDWRAPIANLYYEGELGPTHYESQGEELPVELLLKRQFKIRDGKILSMVDTSEAINDDFLLEILDESSSNHMKNIVSTIQKAQNEIIRDTHSKVLVVEGIAGSGKTSALLQRVAFLLYRNRKWLDNEQVLLFSPNHIFSDYISTVLPSLGESGIPTETFKSFLNQLLPHYQIHTEAGHEEVFLSGQDDRVLRLKSSLALVDHLTHYTRSITEFGPLFRDLKLGEQAILTKEQIRAYYHQMNPELPMYQRIRLLQTKLLKKLGGIQKDEMKKQWAKDAAEELLQATYVDNPNLDDTEKGERKLRRQLTEKVVRQKLRPIKRRIMRFNFINYAKQYVHFLQNIPAAILAAYQLSPTDWQQAITQVKHDLKKRDLSLEDATLLFLLMKAIYPLDVKQKARFIFIDEMQDFAPAQVALLKKLYPKATYTFCGDLNQKVFGNESMETAFDAIFAEQEIRHFELTTSYRSTEEITNFANQFLTQEERVKLTARKGDVPTIYYAAESSKMIEGIEKVLQQSAEVAKYWRTAIICKTVDEAQNLYDALATQQQKHVQLLVNEEDFMKKNLIIIPAFLAKGLEFDRVFAWNVSPQNYHTEQDKLILYTVCTRAMHELNLLTIEQQSPLLETIPEDEYQRENF